MDSKKKFLFNGIIIEGIPSEFLSGIPARDLTEVDWELLTKEQQKQVEKSPLYEAVSSQPKKKE